MPKLEFVEIKPESTHKASIIWLHGLGADGYDFLDIAASLDLPEELGIHFVFPHAPFRPVSLNGGYRMRAWFDIYGLDFDSKQDQEGILAAQKLVEDLIEQELELGIPSEKIILAGFSQGAALALHTGLRYQQQLAGILALSGFLALTEQNFLADDSPNADTPILMLHGTDDMVVQLRWAEFSRDRLLELGFNVAWKSYPMEHNVCAEEIKDIAKWIQDILT
jgi:phospholipase/carboxylesterase